MVKSSGIIIIDRGLLVLRTKNKKTFFAPGGKPEQDETLEETLVRELKEEVSITVSLSDLEYFNTFTAPASEQNAIDLEMHVYFVHSFSGEVIPNEEIEEFELLTSNNINDLKVSSIFRDHVFPYLYSNNLVD